MTGCWEDIIEWRCVVVVLVEDGRDKGGIEKAMDPHVDMHP
jgi:hypothetical protein